jgi:hypothetical protein
MDRVKPTLPDDVDRIYVRRYDPSTEPMMNLVAQVPPEMDDAAYRLENFVKPALQRIEGVGNVDIWGIQAREVQHRADRRAPAQPPHRRARMLAPSATRTSPSPAATCRRRPQDLRPLDGPIQLRRADRLDHHRSGAQACASRHRQRLVPHAAPRVGLPRRPPALDRHPDHPRFHRQHRAHQPRRARHPRGAQADAATRGRALRDLLRPGQGREDVHRAPPGCRHLGRILRRPGALHVSCARRA